jgi:hypothetical protein
MFEKTIEKDLETATTEAERESIANKIYSKYRDEFLLFIEELKNNGIAQKLYNSLTPEETMSLWKEYSSKNQDFFTRIKSWAENRSEYFNTWEYFPLFEENEKIEYHLEIGLMISIVKDECLLSEEDINPAFNEELIALLKNSPNRLLKAAGWYIDCDGYDTMTKENIYKFYSEV